MSQTVRMTKFSSHALTEKVANHVTDPQDENLSLRTPWQRKLLYYVPDRQGDVILVTCPDTERNTSFSSHALTEKGAYYYYVTDRLDDVILLALLDRESCILFDRPSGDVILLARLDTESNTSFSSDTVTEKVVQSCHRPSGWHHTPRTPWQRK
jgi:hypothetical protein